MELGTTKVSKSYDGNTMDNPNKGTCKAIKGEV
jgi:hypothetical protein